MSLSFPVQPLTPVLQPLLHTIVSAELGEGAAMDAAVLARTVQTMQGKLLQMPRYMGMGIAALTLVFDRDGRRFGPGRFRDNPPAARRAQAQAWRNSRLPLMRDFMDFFGKMGIFVYWSHHEGE